jgi:hypothetical protein
MVVNHNGIPLEIGSHRNRTEEKQQKLHLLSSNKEIFGIQKLLFFYYLIFGKKMSCRYSMAIGGLLTRKENKIAAQNI